jgi:hypothetical protein
MLKPAASQRPPTTIIKICRAHGENVHSPPINRHLPSPPQQAWLVEYTPHALFDGTTPPATGAESALSSWSIRTQACRPSRQRGRQTSMRVILQPELKSFRLLHLVLCEIERHTVFDPPSNIIR